MPHLCHKKIDLYQLQPILPAWRATQSQVPKAKGCMLQSLPTFSWPVAWMDLHMHRAVRLHISTPPAAPDLCPTNSGSSASCPLLSPCQSRVGRRLLPPLLLNQPAQPTAAEHLYTGWWQSSLERTSMILIRINGTLCSELSLSFEKDWLLWGWHLSGGTRCLFWRSVLQPWQSFCGGWSIWIQTTLNHFPLNLMCIWLFLVLCLHPSKAQALCLHAYSSVVAELPGDLIPNTPKLPTLVQSSCVVLIFYPIGTGQLKSKKCTTFRGSGIQLCSCMKEHTVLDRILSRFFLSIPFWCRIEFSK